MGSHLCEALLVSGHEVRVLDRPDSRYLDHAKRCGANLVAGDFLNPDDIRRAISNCDVVYHLVSTTLPQTSNDNPGYDVETNVLGTLRMLDEARKGHVKKIVFASSGGTVYGVPQKIPIKENHPTEPICSYGVCKLAIEKYLHLYGTLYALDYCILRIANAYGEKQPVNETQGVIPAFLHKALRHEELIVWGDGSVMRDYTYIGDITTAFIKASNYRGKLKIFNIGTGQGHSLIHIISIIEQIIKRPLPVRYMPGRLFDIPVNILDTSRAKSHLDWQPAVGLIEGISRTFEWMKKEKKAS
jgi:UDP-glucose 4-epimerase